MRKIESEGGYGCRGIWSDAFECQDLIIGGGKAAIIFCGYSFCSGDEIAATIIIPKSFPKLEYLLFRSIRQIVDTVEMR